MVWVRYGVDCDASSTGLSFSLRLCASFSSSLSRLTIYQDELFPGRPLGQTALHLFWHLLVVWLNALGETVRQRVKITPQEPSGNLIWNQIATRLLVHWICWVQWISEDSPNLTERYSIKFKILVVFFLFFKSSKLPPFWGGSMRRSLARSYWRRSIRPPEQKFYLLDIVLKVSRINSRLRQDK